ncbi:VOC family protein [Neobacillus cucumis]|uniref:VOC family protein n=1 Tax=Neobacillus cucumis TaxID=1740721 RepID=UPI0028536517|nr:VOC family protein [Neobacillus cucumis]MDR4950354.1 VOC family protein [Neobacillus cucumis]
MKLKHLNLTVNDVLATRNFLEKYFGLTSGASRGDGFAVMFDDNGFVLTLMKGREVHYPNTFHIGFPQESKEKVDKINQRLKEDGFDIQSPQQLHSYTFYIKAPGGFTIEVLCQ